MSRFLALSLSVKLALAFVAVTVAALIVAGFLIQQATEDEFESYLERRNAMEGPAPARAPARDRAAS